MIPAFSGRITTGTAQRGVNFCGCGADDGQNLIDEEDGMQAQVDDRLVIHGPRGTREGVILELVGSNRYRVRWTDGHESWIAPGPDATVEHDSEAELRAEWEAAKAARHARTTAWRRGVTAGVGREAALAQKKIGSSLG